MHKVPYVESPDDQPFWREGPPTAVSRGAVWTVVFVVVLAIIAVYLAYYGIPSWSS